MTTLTATGFRDYRYDEEPDTYRATVDVQGHRGLYRSPCVRVESVYRERREEVWRYARNGTAAPSVRALELEYLEGGGGR